MRPSNSKCLFIAALVFAQLLSAQAEKKWATGEYEIYQAITKDFAANNFAKAITSLDAWEKQHPVSDYRNERQALYVQAYWGAGQPAKAIDAAKPLLASLPEEGADRLRIIYMASAAVPRIPEPTADQIATGIQAAQELARYDKAPAGTSAADWAKARADMQTIAKTALLYLALVPPAQAMKKQDCAAAESAAIKAIGEFPESVQATWYLGSAQLCLARKDPTKYSSAIYQFARAAALDPVKGMVDPKWQQTTVVPYVDKIYNQYHGADPEGLAHLKKQAVTSPLAPPDFQIKGVGQIAQDKQAEFESRNPELALWMRIKGALLAPNGEEYFASDLKGSAIPQLSGVLLDAKPACNPTELTVGIRQPDSPKSAQPEIVLKLAKHLSGKPELNSELRWEGVAAAFSKEPFRLTMDAETDKIAGLKTSVCSAIPMRKKK